MGINFNKVIDTGWTNFKRNSFLSVAATGMMALTLILFLGLLSLQFLSSQIIANLEEKIDVSTYFVQEATEEQILRVKDDLQSLPEVANVVYVSREQALEEFKTRHARDQLIQESLAELDFNPLAASLNIKTRDASQYASIAQFLEGNHFRNVIEKIDFYENQAVIDRIHNITYGVKSWGLAGVLALSFIAILVTFNTVRLTIYNQKQEIEIMRLVGASNWQIRGPYLAEGGSYGLFASFIALAVFYPVVYLVSNKIAVFAPGINILGYFLTGAPQVVLMVAGLGVFLGVVSSSIAIGKHLKI